MEFEYLPYKEFAKLSDEQILKTSTRELLNDYKKTGNQSKITLKTFIGNFIKEKEYIPDLEQKTKFIEDFRRLRARDLTITEFELIYSALSMKYIKRRPK